VTTLFLARHGTHEVQDRVLAGRHEVSLSAAGREQARALGERLARERIQLLQTSPRRRTQDTAEAIAAKIQRRPEVTPAIDEVDMGEWSGRSFAELASDPRWKQWNAARSIARAPDGETMLDVQMRMTRHVDELRRHHPGSGVVLVTHADVIRATILYYLGLPPDAYWRIEISPGSLTTMVVEDWGAKVLSFNEVPVV
jgi:broad specificity phosphatase PhoE